jgi:hypothetical protein
MRKRKRPRRRLTADEVTVRAEKKLRQADFFMGEYAKLTFPRLVPEFMEYYLSASLSAAQSAFCLMRDFGHPLFGPAQRAWRRAHTPTDMVFHQRMIDLRDDDVHEGTVDAKTENTWVDACKFKGVTVFAPPYAMVEKTNPDGNVVRAPALAAVPSLYIEHDGKRLEAGGACRKFTALLWDLVAKFKLADPTGVAP